MRAAAACLAMLLKMLMRGKYWVQVWQGSLNVPALGSFDVVADFLAGYANLPAMLPANGPVRSSLYTCLSLLCCLMGVQPLLPVLLAWESTLAKPQTQGSKAADTYETETTTHGLQGDLLCVEH